MAQGAFVTIASSEFSNPIGRRLIPSGRRVASVIRDCGLAMVPLVPRLRVVLIATPPCLVITLRHDVSESQWVGVHVFCQAPVALNSRINAYNAGLVAVQAPGYVQSLDLRLKIVVRGSGNE